MINLSSPTIVRNPNPTEQTLGASLEQLQVLREIDFAIIRHNHLRPSLQAIIPIIADYFQADAVEILSFDEIDETFCRMVGCGFINGSFDVPFAAVKGIPGLVLKNQQPVVLSDIYQYEDIRVLPFCYEEKIVSGYSVPLITSDRVQGVLQVFFRTQTALEPAHVQFLEMLAFQVAIAVENTLLWERHQKAMKELITAYATTLEGWIAALDLRDNETEQHSRRVMVATLEIAKAMGMSPDELIQIRRGALLHDIGKIGIPDSILHKPGPLSDVEWTVMRQHPDLALHMLSDTPFMDCAREIPYCHHERWDGSGYPRGLKGEEIPLAARIFAVVDVWDALMTDRPYRKAWNEMQVIQYLRENSGTLFDPSAVNAFFKASVLRPTIEQSCPSLADSLQSPFPALETLQAK